MTMYTPEITSVLDKNSGAASENVVEILKRSAKKHPNKVAYVFLEDGEGKEVELTYFELDQAARALASSLQKTLKRVVNERVLLVYPQGIEFIVAFFATLYAGATAVLVYPPTSRKMAERVKGIIDDCGVACVLSTTEVIGTLNKLGVLTEEQSSIQGRGSEKFSLVSAPWINTDTVDVGAAESFTDTSIDINQLALLQYSSGSTGTPKGVMVSHRNLIANQKCIKHHMHINEHSVIVGWLPMIHDMGLIGNILSPVFHGARLIFMTPLHFVRKPVRWLKAISKYSATITGGPNFAYALCVNKIRKEEIKGLDLSSWEVAFNGAEPVQQDTLARFYQTFGEVGFNQCASMPVYGLAEATLIVSGIDIAQAPETGEDINYVSCGKPYPKDIVKVVDPQSFLEVPEGEKGELWYCGDSAAEGYWNNPEKSKEVFRAQIPGDSNYYMRTGDIGYLHDGNLHVTGRMADIIIIKGRNYHAEDIEWSINDVTGVRPGMSAAFAVEDGDTESVVLVVSVDKNNSAQWAATIKQIRSVIFEDYQIPLARVVLIKPSQLPTTTSGKVRRKECRRMLDAGEFSVLMDDVSEVKPAEADRENFIPAVSQSEKELTALWSSLLNVPAEEIGLQDNFFELGGSSLTMLELANQLDTTIELLFRYPTIQGYLYRDSEYEFPEVEKDIYLPPSAIDESLNDVTNTTLVTGGAGFFGLHFLQSMLHRSEQNFVLLVRGKSAEHMQKKFADAVAYFGMQDDIDMSRIKLIRGDLSKPQLGMSKEDYSWCERQLDRIVHIGSHVNNWLPYEGIREINVTGTRTLLELARTGRKKEFHYTSTSTFSPDKDDPTVFLESDNIDKNEINRYFGYDISKYASETMCKMARDEGLVCNIYRLVWVGGHVDTGRTKVNDGFNIMLRILTTLNVFPAGDYLHDVVPVDLMADSVASLIGECKNVDFNVTSLSKESISMKRIAGMLQGMGYELEEVSRPEFVERLRAYPLEKWDEHCRSYRQLVIRLFEDEEQKFEAFYDNSNFRENVDPDVRSRMEQKFFDKWFEKTVAFLIREGAMPTVSGQSYEDECKVIETSNQLHRVYPTDRTLHELFREQALRTPDALAVISPKENLSYKQLDRLSDMLAHQLIAKGVKPGHFVGVCIGRTPCMMSAILAVLKAGCAYLPLDPSFSPNHLDFMIDDAKAECILVDAISAEKMQRYQEKLIQVDHAQLVENYVSWTDEDLLSQLDTGSSSDFAYIIYTSGTTGKPKGVQVKHRSVINHNFNIIDAFKLNAQDRVLQFTTMNFDVFVQEVFPTWFAGGAVVQEEKDRMTDPEKLQHIITQAQISVLSFPTAFWRAISDVSLESIGVRLCCIAGEEADLAKYNQWRTINPGVPLINAYGPTEATIIVTYSTLLGELEHINIGFPIANVQIHILDEDMQAVPMGFVGDLYIAGECVTHGYLNRPENQQKMFIPNPFCEGELMYRSGDLASWNADGSIAYKGRADNQVKVRGYRVELGAIESVLNNFEGINETAVVVTKSDTRKRIVAYFSATTTDLPIENIRAYLEQRLASYMLPGLIIQLDSIPINPNGKVDRNQLENMDVSQWVTADYQAPQTSTEKILCEVWQQVLDMEQVGTSDNFFELGGHSLLLIKLVSLIQSEGLVVNAQQIVGTKTLQELAEIIDGNATKGTAYLAPENLIPDDCERITPQMLPLVQLSEEDIDELNGLVSGGMANIQDIYPLGPMQQGILFSHTMSHAHDPYILTVSMRIHSMTALEQLQGALQKIIDRHDALRTCVVWQGLSSAVQVVLRRAQLRVNFLTVENELAIDEQKAKRLLERQPAKMNLQRAPLLDLDVVSMQDERFLAHLNLHHIVSDQVGLEIIQKELVMLRSGLFSMLPPAVPYREFIAHTQCKAQTIDSDQFFTRMLADVDQPTAPFGLVNVQGDGSNILEKRVKLPGDVTEQILTLAKSFKISPAVIFHTAWAMVVAVCSGRDDVVFGSVMSGRLQGVTGAADTMGVFINTLPMRVRLENCSAQELIKRVGEILYQMLPYEQVPLSVAQKCSSLDNDTPLFSAFLNYMHSAEASTEVSQVNLLENVDLLDLQRRTNYPFNLSVDYSGDAFTLDLQLDASISCERVLDYIQTTLINLVNALSNKPETAWYDIAVMPDSERQQVLYEWNENRVAYPEQSTIVQLFEAQVSKTPDAFALSYDFEEWTYEELNQEANQLAHTLRQQYQSSFGKPLNEDTLIGLYFDRSIEMLVSIIAVLKAGGAYVPISPDYPEQRTKFILGDTATPIVITQQKYLSRLRGICDQMGEQGESAAILLAADNAANLSKAPVSNLDIYTHAHSLAYVIYTSGTTGKPKGAMVEHRGVINHLIGLRDRFGDVFARVDFATNYCFDLSVTSYLFPLLDGGCVYIYKNDVRNIDDYVDHLAHNQVGFVKTTPSLAAVMAPIMKEKNVQLEAMLLGGEALTEQCIAALEPSVKQLFNEYGPTEATIGSTGTYVATQQQTHIGKPFANVSTYVLTENLQPVPVGVAGELYIGGVGVARGYHQRPELNAERFIENPYVNEEDQARGVTRLYKTGDIVRWLDDGNLEFICRNDFQVKMHGYRIELGEIERVLLAVEGVRQVCVLPRDLPSGQVLAAFIVLEDWVDHLGLDVPTSELLRRHLSGHLPVYMQPTSFEFLEVMPLTANGKVDRRALQLVTHSSGSQYQEPRNAVEETICAIWQDVLGLDSVGVNDNFFNLGGDSILCIKLVSRMRREGWLVQVNEVFDMPTVAQLAIFVTEQKAQQNKLVCEQGVLEGDFLLLPIQKNFFNLPLVKPNHYNQAFMIKLPSRFDEAILFTAIEALAKQHDCLRCCFSLAESPLRQRYVSESDYSVAPLVTQNISQLSESQLEQYMTHWQENFDIAKGPLWRAVQLCGYADGSARLFIAAHHLIMDSVSWRILAEDMKSLLNGQSLESKTSSYRQWVQAVADYPNKHPQEIDYWQKVTQLIEPVRSANSDVHYHEFQVDVEHSEALVQSSNRKYNTRTNDLLLSALALALPGILKQNTCSITLEGHGREPIDENLDVSRTVGWFTTLFPVQLQAVVSGDANVMEMPESDIGDTIIHTKEMMRAIPNNGIGYGSFCQSGQLDAYLPAIKFNYLGQFSLGSTENTNDDWQLMRAGFGLQSAPENNDGNILCIDGAVIANQFHFVIHSRLSESESNNFVSTFYQALLKVTEHTLTLTEQGEIKTPSDYGVDSLQVNQLRRLQDNFKQYAQESVSTPVAVKKKNRLKV